MSRSTRRSWLFGLACIILAAGLSASAQVHNVKVGFTLGVPSGNQTPATGVKLYRAPCAVALVSGLCPTASEGTFAPIANACTGVTSPCVDATVAGGAVYSYYLTATAGTLESVPSMHIGAAVPADGPPPPPTNLTIVSIAMISTPTQSTVTAKWTAAPGTTRWWLANSNEGTIKTGKVSSTSGKYSMTWTGNRQANPPYFVACDGVICAPAIVK